MNETLNDEEKQGHFIGQTSVSVVSMMSGMGLITKTGRIGDVARAASKGADEIGDIKVLTTLDEAKKPKNKQLRNATNEKAMKELVDDAGLDFIADHADEIKDLANFDKVDITAEFWKKLRERGRSFIRKSRV